MITQEQQDAIKQITYKCKLSIAHPEKGQEFFLDAMALWNKVRLSDVPTGEVMAETAYCFLKDIGPEKAEHELIPIFMSLMAFGISEREAWTAIHTALTRLSTEPEEDYMEGT